MLDATAAAGFRGAAPRSGRARSPRSLCVRTETLDIACDVSGPELGTPVVLLHGFPYSVASYTDVAQQLAARGCRVIVPELRGHGATRFRTASAPRSGQQAAIGVDVVEMLDALGIDSAVLAGFDWGGRAACVAAALWPQRVTGLVAVNGYLIQNIAAAASPVAPAIEAGLWYQYYFQTPRGMAGLKAHRRELTRTLWRHNSPTWSFSEDTLARHAEAFDNPDYVDVVIHSYRHRLGGAAGYPQYAAIERRLAASPSIIVPSITLDGDADGVVPATDGAAHSTHFSGPRSHRVVPGAGHNLPEEAPDAFADAVWELASVHR